MILPEICMKTLQILMITLTNNLNSLNNKYTNFETNTWHEKQLRHQKTVQSLNTLFENRIQPGLTPTAGSPEPPRCRTNSTIIF